MKHLICILLFVFVTVAHAQEAYGLTDKDMQKVSKLQTLALERSSNVAAAKRELEIARQTESIGDKILQNTNISVGAGTGNLVPLVQGQFNPTFTISLTVNVTGLAKSEPSQIPALERKSAEAESRVRQDVLTAYIAWWTALDTAQSAAERLDLRVAEFKQVQARASAGTATITDLAKAKDSVTTAESNLKQANTEIVKSKFELARVCGITIDALNEVLKG